MNGQFNSSEKFRKTSPFTKDQLLNPYKLENKKSQTIHNKLKTNEKLFYQKNDSDKYNNYSSSPKNLNFDNESISPDIYSKRNIDYDKDLESIFESSRAIRENGFNMNFNNNINSSKAYLNAMKALQNRIRSLEDEILNYQKKEENILGQKEQEIKKIKENNEEKSFLFKNLEENLKQKLNFLEEELIEKNEKINILLNELELQKKENDSIEEKFNNSIKEYIREKNELKGLIQMKEDKLSFLLQENQNLKSELNGAIDIKQNVDSNINILKDKNNYLQIQIKEITLKNEKERDNLLEKLRKSEQENALYLQEERQEKEKLIQQINETDLNYKDAIIEIQSEKEELIYQLKELKSELEIINTANNELRNEYTEKEKEIVILQEKIDSLQKENSQIKTFSNYTQDVNQKLINNLINESSSNINIIKQKKYNSEYVIKQNENENYNYNEVKKDKENKSFSYKDKKKEYQVEFEVTVQGIIELEKELVELINKYKSMANKISEYDKNSPELPKLRSEMSELNELIHNINQELFDLKKNEERLSLLSK